MTSVLETPAVKKAERALVSAISSLNLQTIKYLANDLGKSEVYSHTWDDCPMTLAEKVGNTLVGKTSYISRNNVQSFAHAWDHYMSVVREENGITHTNDKSLLTNGFGVGVVQRLAQEELAQREGSIYQRAKQAVREAVTTECVRETLGQKESEAIYNAIVGGPSNPNTAIDI